MSYLHSDLTREIINCAIEVHKALGPGLLESAYEECLYYELLQRGLQVTKQQPLPLVYKEIKLDCGYRLDLFVEKEVIVEVKAADALNDLHMAQIMTYMKLTDRRLGLLMNFNVKYIKDGIKRVIL